MADIGAALRTVYHAMVPGPSLACDEFTRATDKLLKAADRMIADNARRTSPEPLNDIVDNLR